MKLTNSQISSARSESVHHTTHLFGCEKRVTGLAGLLRKRKPCDTETALLLDYDIVVENRAVHAAHLVYPFDLEAAAP